MYASSSEGNRFAFGLSMLPTWKTSLFDFSFLQGR
jgi:hypothetical protein